VKQQPWRGKLSRSGPSEPKPIQELMLCWQLVHPSVALQLRCVEGELSRRRQYVAGSVRTLFSAVKPRVACVTGTRSRVRGSHSWQGGTRNVCCTDSRAIYAMALGWVLSMFVGCCSKFKSVDEEEMHIWCMHDNGGPMRLQARSETVKNWTPHLHPRSLDVQK
jgi:hypothetical protein